MSIPAEAVEAAARAHYARAGWTGGWDGQPTKWKEAFRDEARAALEAALPHLLSHEREETRLAHLDAVVNAQTVDQYEALVDKVRELCDDGARTVHGRLALVDHIRAALKSL